MLYRHDRIYKICGEIGISEKSFRKYLQACVDRGLIMYCSNGHAKFIALRHALRILFSDTDMRHADFFGLGKTRVSQGTTVKYFFEKIKLSIGLKNYKQQEWNIKQCKAIDRISESRINSYDFKKLKRLMKKHHVFSFAKLAGIPIKRNQSIVTGKYHLSNLLGCSPACAAVLLRKWAKAGIFTRQVVKRFFKGCNHAHFDALKAEGYLYIGAAKDLSGYHCNVGSALKLL